MYKQTLKLPGYVTFGVEIEFQDAKYDWVEYQLDEWNNSKHLLQKSSGEE
jgi:hypothetical protein